MTIRISYSFTDQTIHKFPNVKMKNIKNLNNFIKNNLQNYNGKPFKNQIWLKLKTRRIKWLLELEEANLHLYRQTT